MRRLLLALIVLSASAWAQYTDNFDRTNSSSLGANWTLGPGGSAQISSNKACANGSSIYQAYTGGGATYANDQYAQALVANVSGSRGIGLAVRISGTSTSAKAYAVSLMTSGTTLIKYTAGSTNTTLASGATIVAGHTMKIVVIGNTIQVFDDTTAIITYTDSTSPITSGSAGILSNGTASTAACLDNWQGGNAGSATTEPVAQTVTASESLAVSASHNPDVQTAVSDSTTTTEAWAGSGRVSPIASDNFDSALTGWSTVPGSVCSPSISSGKLVGCTGTRPTLIHTAKSYPADQYSSFVLDCSGLSQVATAVVRGSAATQTFYGFQVSCNPGLGTATPTLYKMVNGTYTIIAESGASNIKPFASKQHVIGLRVVGNKLYPTIDGLGIGPMIATSNGADYDENYFDSYYTDSSISSGSPGVGLTSSSYSVDYWQGGGNTSNVNIVDGTTFNYPHDFSQYDVGTDISQVTPWVRMHVLPDGVSLPRGAWIGHQVVKPDGGIGAAQNVPSSQSQHRGEYGADQFIETVVGHDVQNDANFNNMFIVLKHQQTIPGYLYNSYAVDYVGYYFGTEPMNHDPLQKNEYGGGGLYHLTKITPTSSPHNEVIALAAAPVFPQAGDVIRAETRGSHLMFFVNGTMVIDAVDHDLDGAQGVPGLFLGTYNFTNESYFKNLKTGTLTDYAFGAQMQVHAVGFHTDTLTFSDSVARLAMNYTRAVNDGANATENIVASCTGTCQQSKQPIVTFIM